MGNKRFKSNVCQLFLGHLQEISNILHFGSVWRNVGRVNGPSVLSSRPSRHNYGSKSKVWKRWIDMLFLSVRVPNHRRALSVNANGRTRAVT